MGVFGRGMARGRASPVRPRSRRIAATARLLARRARPCSFCAAPAGLRQSPTIPSGPPPLRPAAQGTLCRLPPSPVLEDPPHTCANPAPSPPNDDAMAPTLPASRTSLAADMATPCAWLPAEEQMTPRLSCSGVRRAMRLKAPRILKLCTGCASSRLSSRVQPSASLKPCAFSSGVSRATAYTLDVRISRR